MSERDYICIKHDSAACNDCVNDMRVLESALRARIERLKGALSDIQKPHPHKINYTWQNGHIINGRVKKCMAIEIAAQALAEDAGE